MSEKKNIDRLFQEKFKDFEITPDESAWEHIKSAQQKKKNRIVIPLWYKIAGSVAAILLLIGTGIGFFNLEGIQQEVVTNENSNTAPDKTMPVREEIQDPGLKNTNQLTVQENQITEDNVPIQVTRKKNKFQKSNQNTPAAYKVAQTEDDSKIEKHTQTNPNNESIASYKKENKSAEIDNRIANNSALYDNAEKNLATELKRENKSDNEESSFVLPDAINNVKHSITLGENDTLTDQQNKSAKISLLDEINKKKIINSPKEKTRKWSLAPNVAPVYYNTLTEGSAIDPQFSDNGKQGKVNMSYGVQITYAINSKVKIRSGVNKVDLSYGTEEVGFSAFSGVQSLANVAFNENSDVILIQDFNESPAPSASQEFSEEVKTFSVQNEGVLFQELGYIEVPMEISYQVIDKKFGLDIIGGMSTLFLQENDLSLNAGNFTTNIGEATNVNPVSFTGNIGLGLGYAITPKVVANLQPLFKYQINAYQNSSGNFSPFLFGVYTGISFRF